jgi:hypothetical protein
LLNLRNEKQLVFDEAFAQKESLEGQIVVLEDLLYASTDEIIIGDINAKIEEINGEIEELQLTLNDAQEAFNFVADQTIVIVQNREKELAEIEKEQRFMDARSHYQFLEGKI